MFVYCARLNDSTGGPLDKMNRESRMVAWMLLAAMPALLGACEAPLELDGVQAGRRQPVSRADRLQAAASNGETVVVVGNMGAVVVSHDGARTWQRVDLPDKPSLLDVAACPDAGYVALAFERSLWLGDRSGLQWRAVRLVLDDAPQAVTCDPRGGIWVVGGFSTITHSADGGATWETTSLDEDAYLTGIGFVDRDTAFITGEFGVVLRSTNAGRTWQRLEPLPDEFYVQDALFRGTAAGWVVGLNGTIMATADGGRSWHPQPAETAVPLFGITQAGEQLYAVGAGATVLRLSDGRWNVVHHALAARSYLRAVLPLGAGRVLVAGGHGTLEVLSE